MREEELTPVGFVDNPSTTVRNNNCEVGGRVV